MTERGWVLVSCCVCWGGGCGCGLLVMAIRAEGPVEDWLTGVEDGMRTVRTTQARTTRGGGVGVAGLDMV